MISALSHLKLGLLAAGLILWGYGVRTDVDWLRWAGIGFIALAALLRFIRKRSLKEDNDNSSKID